MWTSSYLPSRRRLLVSLLAVLLLLPGGVWLLTRRSHCPHTCPRQRVDRSVARLALSGTAGACVRIDGQILGPLPTAVEFSISRPRRVLLEVCKGGYLDHVSDVVLVPGADQREAIWLSPPRALGVAGQSPAGPLPGAARCPCEDDSASPTEPQPHHACALRH